MSLSSLPTELLDLIATHLDLPGICSLRLTSRHCYDRTFLVFKHRFFTNQHVVWTSSSLQRLVDIATHSQLGDALHHLTIDATPYDALKLWKLRRRSLDAGHLTPLTDDEDHSKLVQRLGGEYEGLQQKAESTAKWFTETRFDIICLKKVFSRSKLLDGITFAYNGLDMRYSKFAHLYCETSQHEMSRPFVSTLSALAASQTTVMRIEFAHGKSYGAISIGRLESLAPSLRYFDAVFEELDTLRLKLRDWRSPDSGFELARLRAPLSVRFLAKCVNVRVLDLSFYSCFEDDAFGELVRAAKFERLECVALELFRVKYGQDLLDFVKPSQACLKDVKLRHMLLDKRNEEEQGWNNVFLDLAQGQGFPQLQVFHAERLFLETPIGVTRVLFVDGETVTSVLRVKGEHWRDELKERAGSVVESAAGRTWESGAIAYPFVRSDFM